MRSPTAIALERPASSKRDVETGKFMADFTASSEEEVRENGGLGGGGGER